MKNLLKNKKKVLLISLIVVVAIIGIVVVTLLIKNKGGLFEEKVKIREGEVAKLKLEEYKNDAFSMKKPTGWVVESGGTGVYYAIKVYDPKDTNNQIFLMLKIQPLLKSQGAKNFWNNYYKLTNYNQQYKVFSEAVVLDNPTTEGFYKKFGEISKYINSVEPTLASFKFPTYNNFTKQEEQESSASMKSVALDSKVLRATFTGENNKDGEGLFMASIVNMGNQYQGGVDMLYYMVYDITAITSSNNEFINYKDILLESVNTIEFNDSYVKKTIDDSNAQTKKALELNASIQAAFNSYMSAWENRSKSYDIMSQKQSDATLGYERVYNTDTGEIYKAYNGFTDDYSGNKYQSITDNMYTEKISGYIEK